MIALVVEGVVLDLPEDQSITYVIQNPVFSGKTSAGSYSYPISLPADSEVNQRVLGHPHRFDQFGGLAQSLSAELRLDGAPIIRGRLVIEEADDLIYEVQLLADASELIDFSEVLLPDLDLGTLSVGQATYRREFWLPDDPYVEFSGTGGDEGIAIRIDGVTYQFREDPATPSRTYPECLRGLRDVINASPSCPVWAEAIGPYPAITGETYAGLLLTERVPGTTSIGVTIEPTYLMSWTQYSVGYADLVAASYEALQTLNLTGQLKLPYFYDPDYSTETDAQPTIGNRYTEERMLQLSHAAEQVGPLFFFQLPYLIERAMRGVGWSVSGPWFSDALARKIIISARQVNPDFETRLDQDGGEIDVPVIPAEIEINGIVPNITIGKLLASVRNAFAVAFSFDSNQKRVTARWLKDVAASPEIIDLEGKLRGPITKSRNEEAGFEFAFDDVSIEGEEEREVFENFFDYEQIDPVAAVGDLPASGLRRGQVCLVHNEGAFYRTVDAELSGLEWVKLFDNVAPFRFGDGESGIETKVRPLEIFRGEDPEDAGREFALPVVNSSREEDDSGSLKAALWHGYRDDSESDEYPYASAHNYDYAATTKLVDLVIGWHGPDGLWQRLAQPHYEFLQACVPFETLVELSVLDLLALDLTRVAYARSQRFLIEEISIPIGAAGLGLASLKGRRY